MIVSNNLVKQLIGLVFIAVLFEGCNNKVKTVKDDTKLQVPVLAEKSNDRERESSVDELFPEKTQEGSKEVKTDSKLQTPIVKNSFGIFSQLN